MLEIVQENEQLYQQLDKMKQLNLLLKEKQDVLEEQIVNVTTKNQGTPLFIQVSRT